MRRYMRKGVALLLAVLVLGVAACGTPDEKQPQQDNVAGEQTPGDSTNPGENVPDNTDAAGDKSDATESGDKSGTVKATVVLSDSGIVGNGTGCCFLL